MPLASEPHPKAQPLETASRAGSWWLSATGLLVISAGWLLVILTIVRGPGVYEAQFMANQAAVTLALLLGTLFAAHNLGTAKVSAFLYLLPLPFAAIILLPYGLRSLAGGALVLPVAAAGALLWQAWRRTGRRPDLVVDCATVTATLALALVLEPVQLIASRAILGHGVSSPLELLGSAAILGVGASLLRRQWGMGGFLAALAVLILGGLNWFTAVALLSMVAIESLLNAPPGQLAGQRRRQLIVAATLVLIACALSWVGLLLPMAAWARGPRRGWFAALVVLGGALALALPSQSWSDVASGLLILLLLFPFVAAALLRSETVGLRGLRFSSDGAWRLLTGLAMTAVALRTLEVHLALIPAALLWCAPYPHAEQEIDNECGVIFTWLGLWLAALVLAASYPWLRPTPLVLQFDAAQQLAGTPNRQHLLTLALCGALAVSLGFLRSFLSGEKQRTLAAPLTVTAVLPAVLLGLWGVAPTSVHTIHRWPPTVLTNTTPSATFPIETAFDGQELPSRNHPLEIWIDSFLANAAELETGTQVARITLTHKAASRTTTAHLVAGIDSAEWRTSEDVFLGAGPLDNGPLSNVPLVPFSYWWTDDEPPNLGQRFRARLLLEESTEVMQRALAEGLIVERNSQLPPNVQLRIDRIALSRAASGKR